MENLVILTESDFKKWVKEAVKECLQEAVPNMSVNGDNKEPLLSRKEIANILHISLVTLTDWIRRGLPSHKQRGRVYFVKEEVLEYIREKKMGRLSLTPKFQQLKKVMG